MPKKKIVFYDFISPYDWSYNLDEGLWYEDKKEFIPPPKTQPETNDLFEISYENGMVSDTDLFSEEAEIKDNDPDIKQEQEEYMEYLFKDKRSGDTFSFTFIFKSLNKTVYIPLNYNGNTEYHIYQFLSQLQDKKRKLAIVYLQEFADNKIYVYTLPNNKIRLVIQNYYSAAMAGPWKILMDKVVDRDTFLSAYEKAVKLASQELYRCIWKYIAQNDIPPETAKNILKKHNLNYLENYRKT